MEYVISLQGFTKDDPWLIKPFVTLLFNLHENCYQKMEDVTDWSDASLATPWPHTSLTTYQGCFNYHSSNSSFTEQVDVAVNPRYVFGKNRGRILRWSWLHSGSPL
jgi:hypothetical protein